jgi:hypothetical protein
MRTMWGFKEAISISNGGRDAKHQGCALSSIGVARLCKRARVLIAALLAAGASALAIAPKVQVLPHPLAPRVDITIDAQPFGSYVYLTAMARPALLSLHAANGTAITHNDESADDGRPTGFWLAHGKVNGIDFSDISPTVARGMKVEARPATAARLVHRRVIEAESSDTQGRLALQTAWTAIDGSTVVLEDTYFTFAGTDRARVVDRVTRLAAVNGPVRLGATTRAVAGLQLVDGFDEREAVGDARRDRRSPCGEARGRWIAIPGVLAGQHITVALFEHPSNVGSPNVVRCRADALELAPSGETNIERGASITLRYRVLILNGHADAAELERQFRDFAG